jgi:integrase
MQTGHIYRKGHSWILDYGVKELRDGKPKWVRRSKKLAPVCDQFRTAGSVRHLAADILAPYNAHRANPESTDTVAHYLEHVYLPHCKATLRPSTAYGYGHLFKLIKPDLGSAMLRDFGPVQGERLLHDFAGRKPRAQSQLKNMKGFLSGAFRYAVRTGVIQVNPMRETMLPKNAKTTESTQAYSLAEIQKMLTVLTEPTKTAVLVAALTGLRISEIRGLRWTDFTGDQLHVRRAVWGSHINDAKTTASVASVPVVAVLRKALEAHRERSVGEYIFTGDTGRPLVLQNYTRRHIIPKLGKTWHGWHGFRRGVSTTLYDLGVPDKVIQEILRHANVAVTMKHYIKTSTVASSKAMRKLERAFVRETVREN